MEQEKFNLGKARNGALNPYTEGQNMLERKYFVLKPRSSRARDTHAIAARAALRKYADWIADEDPELAKDLRVWVKEEATKAFEFYREKGTHHLDGTKCDLDLRRASLHRDRRFLSKKIYHEGEKMRVESITQDLDRGVEIADRSNLFIRGNGVLCHTADCRKCSGRANCDQKPEGRCIEPVKDKTDD